ncbi:MAG TPA: outer membrane protein assembly factor BamE [Pasteurellaceae bacterium]|nr:outer membrane protein assembly factor BamE [Pasteurellaceae bacterium]
MQFKPVLAALILAFGITACSSVNKVVYRIDVPQGNYLEASTVAKVQPGMNTTQVQYLLGTPVLIDPFSNNTWYYVYLQQYSYKDPEQHTFVVTFNQQGIVTDIHLDKPLPDNSKVEINNAIIDAPQPKEKSWWQVWK